MDLNDKKALKEAWVTALTDGSHEQCQSTLYNSTKNSFCCLGVAAHVWGLDTPEAMASEEDECGSPNWEGPAETYAHLNRLIPIDVDPLIAMNDAGESFESIAKVIQEKWHV